MESETENAEKKRTKLEVDDKTISENEVHSAETNEDEGPEQREIRCLEERRNVLRISVCKMRTIEDPEMFLRRSVLIHNTIRRLQIDMGQENFMKFTQNFVSEEVEVNTENDRTSCLVGFLEYQNQNGKEASAKEFHNDLTDYSEYHDNSDEDSDDEDEEDEDDEELCASKCYQDDRTKEPAQDMEERLNPSQCLCYHDSWCRQDCVRGCSARRESNHCATEYRTIRNSNRQGESVFDSVVYHSLLVSLES